MTTETITNVSIFNASNVYQSILLLNQNNQTAFTNLPYVSFSINNGPFKRVKKVHLYLKSLSSPNNYNHDISLRHIDGVEDEYGDVVTVNGDSYLFFDLTLFAQQHNLPFVLRIVNHTSNAFMIFTSSCFAEVEYYGPFDYLDNQQLHAFKVGQSFDVKQDILTFNTYISKQLFNGLFLFDYRLVYDYTNPTADFLSFFPKGWKLNVLETIIPATGGGYILFDECCN